MTTPLLENILNQAEALRVLTPPENVDLLKAHKRIILTGMGASFFACIPFQHMLAKQGFDVTCIETAELLYFPPAKLDPETLLVAVSRSGESIEVVKLLHGLRSPVLGITNVPDTTLAKQATQSILLGSPPDQLVAIQTYTATLALFALLAAALSGELNQAQSELAETIQILEKQIPLWVQNRERFHQFLASPRPLYYLGRGPSMGAVHEGVLLMHETAKSSAVPISIPQFRHGPVETVDEQFRAIILITQPQTETLDRAFAADIANLGGQVRIVGPAGTLCPWPSNWPARFISIAETIPLQILAYTQAELAGIRPGDFRFAPLVTDSETGFHR